MTQSSEAKRGDVLVLVGTRKGGFILSSDASRKRWSVSEPQFAGGEPVAVDSTPGALKVSGPAGDIFHMAYDPRDGGTIVAAISSVIWGPEIHRSRDYGKTWQSSSSGPRFSDGDRTVSKVWHLKPGRAEEPGVVYAGVEPAALFKSEDGGDTWSEVMGPSIAWSSTRRARSGCGSASQRRGVFGTEDGGASWSPMNQGVRADFFPDPFPEFGQCPHKVLGHGAVSDVLYQQNHCGVFRSNSGGADWKDITGDLSSRFGMVLGVHASDPGTIYVIPEDKAIGEVIGGGMRIVTDAQFRVFRSRNAGDDWEPLTKGLPQKRAYLHVMREGMATDSLDPCGVYVGTSTGQLFYSRDDGDSWELLLDYLPPINSVDCGIVV